MTRRFNTVLRAVAASGAALMAGAALPAHADTTAGGYIQANDGTGYIATYVLAGFGDLQQSQVKLDISGGGGSTGASVTAYSPAPSVSYPHVSFADGNVTYQVTYAGPAGVQVGWEVDYSLMARATDYAAASVSGPTTFAEVQAHAGQSFSSSGSLVGLAYTDTPYNIEVDAEAQNGGYAYADPLVGLDPNWVAANPVLASQITVQFSSGVVNGLGTPAAVPEPAIWGLMLIGMGALGAAARRRRLVPTTA